MDTATSFGGPFVLLPHRLAGEWSDALGDCPDPDNGLYGEVCQLASPRHLMHLISFNGAQVLRVADMPDDLFWVPSLSGGLIVQWVAADSLEQLMDFGRKVAEANVWQENLEFDVEESAVRIMDSCGFEGDGQPKIDVQLAPGRYLVEAAYAENEHTMATVIQLTKKI